LNSRNGSFLEAIGDAFGADVDYTILVKMAPAIAVGVAAASLFASS